MKFVADRSFAYPDAAARELVEIANAAEAVQDGRIAIELINGPFPKAGGSPAGATSPVRSLTQARSIAERRLRFDGAMGRPRCRRRHSPRRR